MIGPNSLVRAFCHIDDSTHRGQGFGPFARLRAHSSVDKAYIGNFVEVKNSVIGSGSSLAHFTYSGENQACSGTRELKHHISQCFLLVYAGDADIGEQVSLDEVTPAVSVVVSHCLCLLTQVNIGAGTITCNYGEPRRSCTSASAATPVAAPMLLLQC